MPAVPRFETRRDRQNDDPAARRQATGRRRRSMYRPRRVAHWQTLSPPPLGGAGAAETRPLSCPPLSGVSAGSVSRYPGRPGRRRPPAPSQRSDRG
jgi:hypothetical protein